MGTLCAVPAGGNAALAATWVKGCTGTGADQLTTKVSQTITTTTQYGNSFTIPNGEVIDGVYLCLNRMTAANGTFTITISADNGTTATYNFTFNMSDFPNTNQTVLCFKFGTSITGTGVATYKLGLKTSVSNQLNAKRNSTTNDYFRVLRTTTAAATPAAGDNFVVAAELPSAGGTITPSNIPITWADTGSTAFGNWLGQALTLGKNATLTFSNSASTAYTMFLKGALCLKDGAAFRCGTVASPIPSTSTAVITIEQNATDSQFGVLVGDGAEFTVQGVNHRTATRAYLNANAAVAATTITTDVSTGWKTGDIIAIFPTRRTAAEYEVRVLTSNASGTTVTLPSGLTYLHDGVAPYQAEVILLNRNITIKGTSASKRTGIRFQASSVVNIDYCGFQYVCPGTAGSDMEATGIIDIATLGSSGGSLEIDYCGFYDISIGGFSTQIATSNWAFRNNNIHVGTSGTGGWNTSNVTGSFIFSDNWMTGYSAGGFFGGVGMTAQNNHLAGMNGDGFSITSQVDMSAVVFNGNVIHSCGNAGLYIAITGGLVNLNIGVNQIWRNQHGVDIAGSGWFDGNIVFDSVNTFANQNNYRLSKAGTLRTVKFKSCTIDAGITTVSQCGLLIVSACSARNWTFIDTTFGLSNAHSIADISIPAADNNQELGGIVFYNCKLNSSVEVLNQAYLRPDDVIGSVKHDQIAGNHRSWSKYGRTESDLIIYRTATPSERNVPLNATNKYVNQGKKVSARSGSALTVSVYVRRSAAPDTVYNGALPRLWLKANPGAGIPVDVLLGTATAASAGAWEQIYGTTAAVTDDAVLDFRVDCDGTAGWVNVDDWQVTA